MADEPCEPVGALVSRRRSVGSRMVMCIRTAMFAPTRSFEF